MDVREQIIQFTAKSWMLRSCKWAISFRAAVIVGAPIELLEKSTIQYI